MNLFKQFIILLFQWISSTVQYSLMRVWEAFPALDNILTATPECKGLETSETQPEAWKTNEALRTYHLEDESATKVMVQTDTHAFYVDLERLSACSEYFRGVSQSRMRESSEGLIRLSHVPSSVFYNLLEFSFHQQFRVSGDELGDNIQVASYLLAEPFLSECLSVLTDVLTPDNCLSYLGLAGDIFCAKLRMTVFTYLSRNLLEQSHLTKGLSPEEMEELIRLRSQGDQRLCVLRKENLKSWADPETAPARHLFSLPRSEDGGDSSWCPISELPFRADKWCFTAVVLFNYLYIVGGYRQPIRRGWEFKMASFRYNPFTHTWVTTAPLIKHRRHFSAVACEGGIYAVGGWYLDSLVSPDSNTALYTAVERYDPWQDTWRFVSSLPLTDFQFTVSLSHDVPLATSLGHCVYVLGNIQRTGEKLLLQYNTTQDCWSELLPTLTRADADMPTLYFLGATDTLIVIGGNTSENVMTSFCPRTRQWGEIHTATKVALAGQGTVLEEQVLMPATEHSSVAQLDLLDLSLSLRSPLPIPAHYDAVFHLYF
ncbi:Kelch domain-containing protein 7A [Merluccius polli]|uniref:Kelch domain-containing protein 7A n=1 Tax=Merluccius polli TaxID=89951 RepID=A0AA47N5G7_MERPO|nr:Kelch domain-containing protein 7A [Merluccius polli]